MWLRLLVKSAEEILVVDSFDSMKNEEEAASLPTQQVVPNPLRCRCHREPEPVEENGRNRLSMMTRTMWIEL
jgi:hypothetical protein